ncbi:hypothetical protein AB9P05_09000 [Roseivirga sp. BDSF3-8]|uniref:hypothetical protein n=1 Tax=Roseivirga sp. BDSF3-8 TaxID=3241598 RepID=UPI003532448F
MRKVIPQFYEGKEIVQLSRLPLNQANSLRDYLSAGSYMTIRVDDVLLHDCVAYDEYEYWFEYCFTDFSEALEVF